jgi:ElaB/YqjD/DUF883 family membrane-anchored ribosome-binding protein
MMSVPQNRTSSRPTDIDDLRAWPTNASEIAQEAQERLREAGDIFKNAVTNRPVLALGAALAAGVCLGWLIKRR